MAWRLELAGYRVLLQAWDFGAGSFVDQMEEAVQRSRRLIVILSEPYLGSKWGRQEWAAFMKIAPASVIPVQIEDISIRTLLGPLVRINLAGLAEQAAGERLLRDIERLAEPPGHEPRDRSDSRTADFPGISDTAGEQDSVAAPAPAAPVDRNRIELILLGDGEDADEAVASFRRLLDIPPERCCDLFGSELAADEQLARLTRLVQDLDPEVVSDVLVVYAGTGSNDRDAGVRLRVRATDAATRATSTIGLVNLLECLTDDRQQVRSCVILDVVDAEGRPVGPTTPGQVPVLALGRGAAGRGLAEVQEVLAMPTEELIGKLPHWGPLSLRDLHALVGGELVADEHSPASQVGLIPSPLAWPRRDKADDTLANWCAVVSESDARRSAGEFVGLVVDKLASQSRGLLNQAYRRWGHAVQLDPSPGKLLAGNVLSSPGSFGHAVEQVCRAELAIFDLTNYEPAVMILLGIRAVIRRGLTVCVVGQHDQPWQDAESPFHLREVSLLQAPDRDAVEARIVEGIKQLAGG